MVSDLGRYYRGERNCALIRYRESEVGRTQERSERPRRKEQKRQAKAARKRRAIERQLQAPCQNSVEDSGPGSRGGRVSTTRSELISSEPFSGDPNDEGDGIDNSVWNLGTVDCPYELDRKEASTVGSETDSGDGNDCTDETVFPGQISPPVRSIGMETAMHDGAYWLRMTRAHAGSDPPLPTGRKPWARDGAVWTQPGGSVWLETDRPCRSIGARTVVRDGSHWLRLNRARSDLPFFFGRMAWTCNGSVWTQPGGSVWLRVEPEVYEYDERADPEEEPLYSEEGSTDEGDCAGGMAPGETDDEGEKHADSEDEFLDENPATRPPAARPSAAAGPPAASPAVA